MSTTAKKIFLFLTIMVPFLFYCVYYYGRMLKNAPYKFTEFKSITIQFGSTDSLVNKYDSETGIYQFLDNHDSLVTKTLKLNKNDLLYLHRKAADLGFWDFPSDERSRDTIKYNGVKPVRFIIAYNYQRKSKKVIFDSRYAGDPKLIDANKQLIKEIQHVLANAEEKQKK